MSSQSWRRTTTTSRGVFGVNDSMALGAVDVLKANHMIGKVVVFGDDGEADARWAANDGSTSPMSGLAT
jgi:ABC-type sugar transport system substrate-binding protein